MNYNLSNEARQIMAAGLAVIDKSCVHSDQQQVSEVLFRSSKAIDMAVADLCGQHRPYGEEAAVDALKEIVQAHVKQLILDQTKPNGAQ